MKSLSFDGMIQLYDQTRVFDPACFKAALDYFAARFPLETHPQIFEAGIGTGRIAIPLAQRGYEVTGVDISGRMLSVLKQKLARLERSLPISFQQADVTALPFLDSAFDMAIAVHLFYFIPDWRKAANEILRTVKSGHPLILMHTGMGSEIPLVNERYKEICAEHGCPITDIGVKSTGEVVDYLKTLGHAVETTRGRWRWMAHVRVHETLRYIRSRAYSFTVLAPDAVHFCAVEQLENEMRRRFTDFSAEIEVPNEIYYVVVEKR